jgi:hypothetical protein
MSAELSIRGHRPPERYSHAFGGSVDRLPDGWSCGRHCDIGGEPGQPVRIDLVLLHPGLGVVLLDIGARTERAEEILRARLEEARFGAIFGGYLPVIHGCLAPDEVPAIAEIARAFDQVPPLSVSGGSAWMSTVSRLVVPVDRVWADNWDGAPNRGAAPRLLAEPLREAKVVPLRRVATVQPPDAAPEDLVPPAKPPAVPSRKPWLIGAGAALAAMAVAAGLWLSPGQRPEPAARNPLAAASIAVPAAIAPMAVAATPALMPPSAMPTPPAAAAPMVTAPAIAVQRPASRPVRLERPARVRAPAKPAPRAAVHRPGRG